MSDTENLDSAADGGLIQPRLVRLFPYPWQYDVSRQETPPERRSATIFAADSTRICEIRGEHAEAMASLIVGTVNHYLPNVQGDQPKV